ncbi:hypothetical protein MRX96_046754, partial [Rhipicephalus microplus]
KRVAVLWVIAVAITMLVCLFPYAWDSACIPYDRVLAALYASLYPVLWSVSVSWMLHSCITGTAGLANRFLSMGVFIPLGKLSFSLYLVHPYVLYMKVVTIRQFRAMDHWTMVLTQHIGGNLMAFTPSDRAFQEEGYERGRLDVNDLKSSLERPRFA